jgi:hypothetical protein
MTLSIKTNNLQPHSYTIYRPEGEIDGYRQVHDPAGGLAVAAFPIAMAKDLAATCELLSACYVIVGHGQALIGESIRALQCVAEHAVDPAKAFASEVYLVHAQEPHMIAWSTRLRLARRLAEVAQEVGLVTLADNAEPRVAPYALEHAATLERLVTDGRRLLFDAGCRVFNGSSAAEAETDQNVDGGIDVPGAPGDLEFDYCGIRAWGYHDLDGFVVARGSEVRNVETASLRRNIKKLRADLRARGVLVPIAGVKDRLRFAVAWQFFSPAVAAKLVAGAHVAATKWVRPRRSRPIARAQ